MSKKNKYSEEEKRGFVREWEAGGGSQLFFADRLRVSEQTFYTWCRKYRETPAKHIQQAKSSVKKEVMKQMGTAESCSIKAEVEFVPVNVVAPDSEKLINKAKTEPVLKVSMIEIRLGNGMVVAFDTGTDCKYVGNLIGELTSW